MSSNLKTYLGLLRFIDDASKDLGLQRLTPADKHILLALSKFVDETGNANGFTYATYCKAVEEDEHVSRAQFFKSLDNLLEINIVSRTGAGRSSNYALLT